MVFAERVQRWHDTRPDSGPLILDCLSGLLGVVHKKLAAARIYTNSFFKLALLVRLPKVKLILRCLAAVIYQTTSYSQFRIHVAS